MATENKSQRSIRRVEVSGTPYEMGFQYGAACPEIGKMFDITCHALELDRDGCDLHSAQIYSFHRRILA